MGEPKEDKKKDDKKKEEKKSKGPSLDFLKVDRSLRPEGMHFDAEMMGK